MTYDESLDILDEQGHAHSGRYRELCAEANPDRRQRDGYRRIVLDLVAGTDPVAAVLAAAKAEMGDTPIRTEPYTGCCS